MKQSSSTELQSFATVSNDIMLLPTREILVTGKVICMEESFPLERVHICIKDTNYETYSNKEGSWFLRVPNEDCILEFDLPGFEKQDVSISKSGHLEIVLERLPNPLNSLFYSTVLQHQVHA